VKTRLLFEKHREKRKQELEIEFQKKREAEDRIHAEMELLG